MAKDDTEILEVFTRINTLLAENRDNTLEIKALLLKQGEGIGKALMSAMEEKFSGRSSDARTRYIESMSARVPAPDDKTLYCSFCGKSQHEVKNLIAGPAVFICDECVVLCGVIIREENRPTGGSGDENSEADGP